MNKFLYAFLAISLCFAIGEAAHLRHTSKGKALSTSHGSYIDYLQEQNNAINAARTQFADIFRLSRSELEAKYSYSRCRSTDEINNDIWEVGRVQFSATNQLNNQKDAYKKKVENTIAQFKDNIRAEGVIYDQYSSELKKTTISASRRAFLEKELANRNYIPEYRYQISVGEQILAEITNNTGVWGQQLKAINDTADIALTKLRAEMKKCKRL